MSIFVLDEDMKVIYDVGPGGYLQKHQPLRIDKAAIKPIFNENLWRKHIAIFPYALT